MVRLPFLNRTDELTRIRRAISRSAPSLMIVYGRRRCGKTRLLQQLPKRNTIYYLADQSDESLQREGLAHSIDCLLPGFGAPTYTTWTSLFDALSQRAGAQNGKPLTLIIDEFPYLVSEHPPLLSLIQKMIDLDNLYMHLILCGSSQRFAVFALKRLAVPCTSYSFP